MSNTDYRVKEQTYRCSNRECDHTQNVRFSPDEVIFPVTNCVPCQAGFGMTLGEQMQKHVGMFPEGRARFSV